MSECSTHDTMIDFVQKICINLLNFSTEATSSNETKLIPRKKISNRRSILNNLDLELNSNGTKENVSQDTFWEQFLNEPQLLSIGSDSESNFDSESFILQAVIWMKAVIQTSNKILSNNIHRVLENFLKTVPGQFSQLAANDIHSESQSKETTEGNDIQKKQETEFDSGMHELNEIEIIYDSNIESRMHEFNEIEIIYDSKIESRKIHDNESRLPFKDEEASQISNPMNFSGESSIKEFREFNNETINLGNNNKNDRKRSKNRSEVLYNNCKRPDGEPLQKKVIRLEKAISSEYIQFILEKFQADNYCLEILKRIINNLSYEKVSKNLYKRKGVHKAVRTLTNFINIICKEKNTPMKLMDSYINPIVALINKVFDFSSFEHFEIHNKEAYMRFILEFCDCKLVCEKTITFLIEKLKQLINSENDSEERNDHNRWNETEKYFILQSLEITLKKYCTMKSNTSEPSTSHPTNQRQRQFRHYLPRSEEQLCEEEFILKWTVDLNSLLDVEVDCFSNSAEYIEELINILIN